MAGCNADWALTPVRSFARDFRFENEMKLYFETKTSEDFQATSRNDGELCKVPNVGSDGENASTTLIKEEIINSNLAQTMEQQVKKVIDLSFDSDSD